ncbi:cytochrome P460 family protein [Pelagibius sp. Alg239-R121]|uniref:cytochrome P460 family protein n=1 Tax=Pelagibius sp. Alg239-R121 TaxID=2993448 RepID=UPI0024A6B239|nr:cytochrome P460 family protein [Pelagibius sp. Alg239-R121]
MQKTARTLTVAAIASLTLAGVIASTAYGQMTKKIFAEGVVSEEGSITLPKNFRTDYTMLGAWSVAGDVDTGGEVGLHVVYAPRSAVDGYRKDGSFPDGTVLVKELFKGKTESLTTGEATSAAATAGYFVMVKDTQGRFPDNKNWGDGWGWSFFAADNTTQATTKDYKAECLACHEPARFSDLVYDYAYPVLRN